MKENAPLWMRTPRRGRWLLSQPRSGARVRLAGLFVLLPLGKYVLWNKKPSGQDAYYVQRKGS